MGICSTYQVLISGLYGGISTRYRYLVMVLNSFVVVNSFRLVSLQFANLFAISFSVTEMLTSGIIMGIHIPFSSLILTTLAIERVSS